MHPWLRLLVVFVAVVLAALFLKVLPAGIVLLMFIGGVAAVNVALKRRVRTERKELGASSVGLRSERHDPFGLLAYPFALFSRCGQPAVEDVRWGTWRGFEVKRFDLSCSTRGGDRARFACAIGPAPLVPLPLIVEERTWGTLLAEPALPDAGDHGPYVVRCADPALAGTVAGRDLLGWLRELEEPWGFELNRSLALVYGLPSMGEEGPLERLQRFTTLVDDVMPDPTPPQAAGLGERGRTGLGERGQAS